MRGVSYRVCAVAHSSSQMLAGLMSAPVCALANTRAFPWGFVQNTYVVDREQPSLDASQFVDDDSDENDDDADDDDK